jgi:hypothetical protein
MRKLKAVIKMGLKPLLFLYREWRELNDFAHSLSANYSTI